MADGSWLLIFRALPTEELQARSKKLLDSMSTLSSQTVGQKSFTRDLRHFQNQLEAIVFVLRERQGAGYKPYVVVDFSGTGCAPPAGTVQGL